MIKTGALSFTGTKDETAAEEAEETYSMSDMFTKDIDFLESNIFRLKQDLTINGLKLFDFVQIKRHEVTTVFSKNVVLEIADISQKVLLDMARGERRLLTLINATVSHEMRNPVNSIHVQVLEMGNLNEQLSYLIEQLSNGNVKKMKKKLASVL